jgi:hypothetical protein
MLLYHADKTSKPERRCYNNLYNRKEILIMKKLSLNLYLSLSLLLSVIVSMTFFTSCAAVKYDSYKELNNGSVLQRGSITYSFYGALPGDVIRGKQIGIVDDDNKHKIYDNGGSQILLV